MLTLQETIIPYAYLKKHYNEISAQCKEGSEAVIIMVNERSDTASLVYDENKRMKLRIEMLEMLSEAEDDVKSGRFAPVSGTFDDLRKILQED